MKLTTFLKKQLQDLIDVYDQLLARTYGIAMILSIVCFMVIILFMRMSNTDLVQLPKPANMVNYFFYRYSAYTYNFVDLSKTVFIFCVSLFSLALVRSEVKRGDKDELNIKDLVRSIQFSDILYLIGVLIGCAILDYGLFHLNRIFLAKGHEGGLYRYVNRYVFLFRIYLPLMLFGFATYRLGVAKKIRVSLSLIGFYFISLWIFNEFAYELFVFVKIYVFGIVTSAIRTESRYFIESLFGIFLIAFYFVGYYSAMINPLKLFANKEVQDHNVPLHPRF